MKPSLTEHRQAIEQLAHAPGSTECARRVFELARQDPRGAGEARQLEEPALPALPLDLVRHAFSRNNLNMGQAPRRIEQPTDLAQLLGAVQRAASEWLPLKAIGDGYGFANTGETRGCLLPMVQHLNRILPIDRDELCPGVDVAGLCRFEAGTTIAKLTHSLAQSGRAVLNQPGFEKLTYVGTMASGGHGSGSWCGPLSDHVKALHLITLGAERQVIQLQVEPSQGISDPQRFQRAHPECELVQDDRMFHACSVAMGCLGVIYSATIEVRKNYQIKETRSKWRWRDLKSRLPGLIADQGPGKRLHSIEVWLNPYPVENDVWCVLGEREETRELPRGERAFAIEYGGPEFFYQLLSWWMQAHPTAVPTIIDIALSATQAKGVILSAAKGLNFGAPNLAPVTACSCGVPSANIAALTDQLIAFFQRRAREHQAYITSPVGLRFVKAAKAYLSPAFGRDTCMIEVPALRGTPKARDTLRAYHDFLFEHFNGRPHWGQVNDMSGARLEALYPELDAFLESFRVLNPGGFFDNAFTEQLGFRALAG